MKVGDTVKLKPAMWQGIKPESYGLSFTGEYVVEQYIDMQYPAIKLEGFNRKWDAGAFQVVVKEKEEEVSNGMFGTGDKVFVKQHKLSKETLKVYGLELDKEYEVKRYSENREFPVVCIFDSGYEFPANIFEKAVRVKEQSIERPVLEERKKDKIRMELFDEGFPNAILEVAKVMTWASENKGYKDHDWVNLPDADSAFSAAASRHKLKGIIQKLNGVEVLQRTDEESNILHKAHEVFNGLAELELMLRGVIK